MGLRENLQAYIKKENLFQPKDELLIAVSGGADSSVLCALCAAEGYHFSIAHCNFKLRGEESDRDEAFVRALGLKYGVEVFVKEFDTLGIAAERKTSVEETARNLRYDWFKELTTCGRDPEKKDFDFLLTAHHADDNAETVLMNFLRGTGIKGLRGILPKHGNIIRPILFARRKEIEEFALQNNIDFITDSSNAASNYTRNFFRNDLIPAIEKVFPKVSENILNNIERFSGIEYLYEKSTDEIKENLVEKKGAETHIPVLKLAKTKPLGTVIYEIIKEYGFAASQVPETEKLLTSESGKYIVSATHRILRNRKWLIIGPLQSADADVHHIIEEHTASVIFSGGEIKFTQCLNPAVLSTNADTAYIDTAKLTYPLLLRKWKQGDYFYPLGMSKKKKLSRFFSDIKLSLAQKEKVWVIESDKKIVWVVGHRIDDRFKITALTKDILKQDLIHPAQKGSAA